MPDDSNKSRLQVAGDRLAAMASTITGRPTHGFPSLDDLPKVEGQPQGCLWGFFDKGQKKDEIGSKGPGRMIAFQSLHCLLTQVAINLLTPTVVKKQAVRFQLENTSS